MNNSLLAILLKNFRWLKIRLFHRFLNNSSIVQGVLVCLCVIQFTRYTRSRQRTLPLYIRSFHLSRTFFILFQIYFRSDILARSTERLGILAEKSRKVNTFFHFFTTIFFGPEIVVSQQNYPQNVLYGIFLFCILLCISHKSAADCHFCFRLSTVFSRPSRNFIFFIFFRSTPVSLGRI